jgi:hypothetical protein
MAFQVNRRSLSVLALCIGAAALTGCGTSSDGSRYNMQTGVSDSGYPPKGAGQNPGSPATSSMSPEASEKGIEGERMIAPKQNIPSNVAGTPRS